MNILILGCRGVAKELALQAYEKGFSVRVLARDSEKVDFPSGIEIMEGDVLELLSLKKAMQNQDIVCSCIGTKPRFSFISLYSEGMKNILEAMHSAGVERLVSLSRAGVGESKDHAGFLFNKILYPTLYKTLMQDKEVQERLIRHSDIAWMIVRPANLTNGGCTKDYFALTHIDGIKATHITRADVAHFILTHLDTKEYQQQATLLTY